MKVKTNMKKLWCVLAADVIGVFAGQIMSDMIVIATDEGLGHMFSDIFSYFPRMIAQKKNALHSV